MSRKSAKIANLIESCHGQDLPAHYLGYFECFNQGWFYEAHDVLEELWLAQRNGPNYAFYKGLIQFAGAFVHMQKHCERYPRLRPSAALLKLTRANLQQYPTNYHSLDVANVISLTELWLGRLEANDFAINPLTLENAPKLVLKT